MILAGSASSAAGDRGASGVEAGAVAKAAGKCKGKHAGGKKCKGKGRIHKAWPHKKNGRKPTLALARKLARQIGPVKIQPSLRTEPSGAAPALRPAKSSGADGGASPVVGVGGSGEGRLLLVRSFDIPEDDRQYADLANYSWTYDNALATNAFVADNDRSQARQLLDQLAALQKKDGSISFAFDVATGGESPQVRSGTLAWVGLAAAAYADRYRDKAYDPMIRGLLDYLLALRNDAGLIRGGTDVTWVSTQHNLLAAELLRQLHELQNGKERFGYESRRLGGILEELQDAIGERLLVGRGDSLHFRQGQGDDLIPLDVQALGALHLQTLEQEDSAEDVAGFILQPDFFVAPRSTPAAPEKVSGLRPFLDPESPDLIWTEGTIEAQFALERLDQGETQIADAVASLAATKTRTAVGPIGSDRNSDGIWGDYRTWPTSAATSWLVMLELEKKVQLFDD